MNEELARRLTARAAPGRSCLMDARHGSDGRRSDAAGCARQGEAGHGERACPLTPLAPARAGGEVQHPDRADTVSALRGRAHGPGLGRSDRKSTRLNSSHTVISYAVFCLKKKSKT